MRLKEITRNPKVYFPLFFLFLFFYYLLIYNPSLYYHYHQPIFLFDKIYIKEFLSYPGGPVECIAQFLFQFFRFNLLGSLIISALLVSIFIIVYKLIKKIGDFKYSLILSFLPVAFLLIIQNQYNVPLLITVKYLLALVFYFAYVKLSNRHKVFFIFLSFLIYYISGGWAYLFLIVLCSLHELLFREERKKYVYTGINVLVYLIYPYIAARYLFLISLKEAYLYIAPYEIYYEPFLFKPGLCFYLAFISFPVVQIGLFLFLKYFKNKIKNRNKSLLRAHSILAQSIFIIILGVLVLAVSLNRSEEKKIQIDCFALQEQWGKILLLSNKIDDYDRMVNFNVNRALYNTGQLLDNLFVYPQLLGTDGLFVTKIIASQCAIPASDLYFDLGHIKASQVMAYEGQTKFKYNPRILKRLAMTNMIDGEYVVARKFLDLLDKSILHKKWAEYYEKYLYDKSLIKTDSLIQLKRSQRPDVDFFIDNVTPKHDLVNMLKKKNKNKMAFEYLMAYFLLEGRLENLVRNLDKFKDLGYKKYPRHIEEALLLYSILAPSKKFKIDYRINPSTVERFKQFSTILSKCESEAEAKRTLEKNFKDTYWYYVRYLNPKVTNSELKRRKINDDIL